jgi:methylmalonyl-CoA/ethylmalonyl-CoA epimerase
MWELIEPLDEDGIYARFLAEKGEGVHHVAVATPDFDETFARAERKDGVMLSCKHSGIDIAYLDTLRDPLRLTDAFALQRVSRAFPVL